MAEKTQSNTFGEDEYGRKLDRCFTDTMIKAGTYRGLMLNSEEPRESHCFIFASFHYVISHLESFRKALILVRGWLTSSTITKSRLHPCRRWTSAGRCPLPDVLQATKLASDNGHGFRNRNGIHKLREGAQQIEPSLMILLSQSMQRGVGAP